MRRNRRNQTRIYAIMLPLMAGVVAIFAIWLLVGSISFNRQIQNELLKREQATTALHVAQTEQKIIRSEQVTEFIGWLLNLLFWMALAALVGGLLWNALFLQRSRVSTANGERWKVAGNGRYLIDTFTSETLDLTSGQIYMNDSTVAKLSTYAQVQRIEALSDGTRWTTGKAKAALGSYRQLGPETTAQGPQNAPQLTVGHDVDYAIDYDVVLAQNCLDLMQLSERYRWVMGQSESTGELSEFNVLQDCNLLICGARGQGKTQAALLLMAYGISNGFHVLVGDGKGGLDFRKYADRNLIEWTAIDVENMFQFIASIQSEYERRLALMSDARAQELDAYNAQSDQPIDRVLVIIEEFGGTLEAIRAVDVGLAKSIIAATGALLKRARATGIHFVLLDQTITEGVYNNSIKGNVKYITYKLPGQQYRVLDVDKNVKLLGQGEFMDYETNETGKFKAFLTEKHITPDSIKAQRSTNPLLTGSKYAPLGGVTSYAPPSGGYDNQFDTTQHHPITSSAPPYNHPSTTPAPPYNQLGPVDWTEAARMDKDQLRDALPKLAGEPIHQDEIDYVLAAYENLDSRNKVYAAVWGSKNNQRQQWLESVINSIEIEVIK